MTSHELTTGTESCTGGRKLMRMLRQLLCFAGWLQIAAVSICTGLFLAVAIGSYAVFGDGVPADVLENFTGRQEGLGCAADHQMPTGIEGIRTCQRGSMCGTATYMRSSLLSA